MANDNELFLAKEDETNTPQYNESQIKEQVYTEERDKAQADINDIRSEEQTKQDKPVSKNIFRRMKEAFEKNQVDRELERHQKEHLKKEYEVKIQAARSERKMADMDQKYRDKLAYEALTKEEKAARAKQKIGHFADKLSTGLGNFSGSKMVDIASKGVERNVGAGQSASGSLPGGDRIAMMMGGRTQQGPKTYGASGSGDRFSTDNLHKYLGTGTKRPAAETNTLAYFPKSNIGGVAKKSGQYLGQAPRVNNFSAQFGSPGVDINKHLPRMGGGQQVTNKKPVAQAKQNPMGGSIDFGGNINKMLGKQTPMSNPLKSKSKIIDVEPQDSQEARMKRLIGL